MATTYSILEQQLTNLSSQLDTLRRQFDLFRGYANQQFSGLHERLATVERQLAYTATKEDVSTLQEQLTATLNAQFDYLVSLITAQHQNNTS